MDLSRLLSTAALACTLSAAFAAAADNPSPGNLPAELKIVGLEVRPAQFELSQPFDYRQLLVSGKLDTGESVDLTRHAQASVASPCVTISSDGLVRPKADGESQIEFKFRGLSAQASVKVSGIASTPPVSFVRDVQPVFSRMGCNQGTCHGAKDGKNGFKLSLRGYDALYDHRALTDDIAARRFNRAAPEQSLLLLKATGAIPHVGGVRTDVGHPYYELVKEWIAQGVKLDLAAPRVAKLEVFPLNPVVPRAGMKQQITVIATFTDGLVRDVTHEAFIESGNIEVIEAEAGGRLLTLRRGEAPVLIRYEGNYVATTIVCMGDRTGYQWQETPAHNYIDELVHKKLRQVKVLPSEICTDAEFCRRVYLDLTGLPPTADQTREFLADARASQTKRDELIDRLVGGREYVEQWTNKWADLLQVNRKFLGEEGSVVLRNWIKQSIAANKPYDQFAYEILTAKGSTIENPPAAYYKVLRDPAGAMENTTHLFLAVRFNCNKCHDHPFERWTQDQYYHLAAYFAQVGRKEDPFFSGQKIGGSAVEGAAPLVEVVFDAPGGDVKHDRTGQISPPVFPYQPELTPAEGSRREQLARWITSKNNQYFAKSYVNRLWGYLFGVGIIEPIDDIRAGNPPTNPELLDALTADFIQSGFNTQHILRTICRSRTYQLSVKTNRWNEDDGINYSHAIPRRLSAEALFDAIHVASGSAIRLNGVPVGFRAAELPDAGASDPFLDDFGKPVRESACECERSSGIVLGPVMKLINGPTVANALADPTSQVNKLAASAATDQQVIDELFLRFLGRPATERELKLGQDAFAAAKSDTAAAEKALADYEKSQPERLAAWEASAGKPVVWTPVTILQAASTQKAEFKIQPDQSVLVSGPLAKDLYTLTAESALAGITGLKLEALPDPSLPAQGPGRAQNGNFVLHELRLSVGPKGDPAKAEAVPLQGGTASFSQQGFSAAAAIDGNETTGWAVSPEFGKPHEAIFETKSDAGAQGGSSLVLTLSQQFPDGAHNLGRLRVSVTTSPRPLAGEKLPAPIAAILAVEKSKRTPEQAAALLAHVRQSDGELARLTNELKRAQEQASSARLIGVQDLAWALLNNPAFLFNR